MNVLDAAIYLMMVSDTGAGGIATISTGGIHQLDAPEEQPDGSATVPPYTIFRSASNDPNYTFGNTLAFNYGVYAIQGYATDVPAGVPMPDGLSVSGAIADRLFTLFLNAALTVSGRTVACCRPLSEIAPQKERDTTSNRWLYSRGWLIETWLT